MVMIWTYMKGLLASYYPINKFYEMLETQRAYAKEDKRDISNYTYVHLLHLCCLRDKLVT